jgi:hypothetical protein
MSAIPDATEPQQANEGTQERLAVNKVQLKELAEVGIRLTHQTPMPSMRKWKTILGT